MIKNNLTAGYIRCLSRYLEELEDSVEVAILNTLEMDRHASNCAIPISREFYDEAINMLQNVYGYKIDSTALKIPTDKNEPRQEYIEVTIGWF